MTDPTDDAPALRGGPRRPADRRRSAPTPAVSAAPADRRRRARPPSPRRARPGWWDRVILWFGGHPPTTARQRARSRAIRRGVVAGIVMVVVGSIIQLPLLVLSPGPTYNTIGEVNGEPLITISGTTTYPTDGCAGHAHGLRAGRLVGRGLPR